MANLPAPPYDLSDCTVTLKDGTTPTANELALFIDDGNVTWQVGRNIEYKLDRQKLSSVKEGDEIPLSVTFNCRFSEIASSSGLDVSPFEFLTNTGAAVALPLVTTSSNVCDRPIAIDIEVFADRNCSSGLDSLQDETITFPAFRYDTIDGDFNAGQLNVTGRCNAVIPTAVRSAPV